MTLELWIWHRLWMWLTLVMAAVHGAMAVELWIRQWLGWLWNNNGASRWSDGAVVTEMVKEPTIAVGTKTIRTYAMEPMALLQQ